MAYKKQEPLNHAMQSRGSGGLLQHLLPPALSIAVGLSIVVSFSINCRQLQHQLPSASADGKK